MDKVYVMVSSPDRKAAQEIQRRINNALVAAGCNVHLESDEGSNTNPPQPCDLEIFVRI